MKNLALRIKKHYLGIGILALVLIRVFAAFPLDNTTFIGGTDTSSHLFKVWYVSEYGFTGWSEFWYGGFPFLAHYPPLFYIMAGYLGQAIGYLLAYKIVIDFFFLLLPVAFYLFLKEFALKDEIILPAVAIFSLLPLYSYYFFDGRHASLISFFFALFYWKFLKRTIDSGKTKYMLVSSAFLFFSLMSHHLTGFVAIVVSAVWAFSCKPSMKSILRFSGILALSGLLFSVWLLPFAFEDFSPTGTGLINYGNDVNVSGQILTASYLKDFGGPWTPYLIGPAILLLLFLTALSFFRARSADARSFCAVLAIILAFFFAISYKRSLFFIMVPVSVLASFGIQALKGNIRKFASAALIILLVAGFFSLRGQAFTENGFPSTPQDGRVLFLPVGGLSEGGVNKNMYEVLLTATNGNENILGWQGESQSKAKGMYNSMISDPSKFTADEYYSLLSEGWVNYVIVKKGSGAEKYFLNNSRFGLLNESGEFLVFGMSQKSSYMDINGNPANVSVAFGKDKITIYGVCAPGEARIKETFDRGWSATVNGKSVELAPDEYGFTKARIKESGNCSIEMKYSPYWFL